MDDARVLLRSKLGPGHMIAVDTARGLFFEDGQIKAGLAARKPYGLWVHENIRRLAADSPPPSAVCGQPSLITDQAAFGYTSEELVTVMRPMVEEGAEAIDSMGDDTALAALSPRPRPLFGYFRQRFAEVTNPPIDPLREGLVMSLRARIGARGNFLAETPEQARLLELESPFLTDDQLAALKTDPELEAITLSTLFPAAAHRGAAGLRSALERLCAEAEQAARAGAQALLLSDRGVDADHTFVPSLLALGAVHNHLLRAGLRTTLDIVIESGEPREVHHFAALVGYGAAALNPYLALATAAPEHLMVFMRYVAEEVREILAGLGLKSLNQAIGRADLLRQKPGSSGLDLGRLLLTPPTGRPRRFMGEPNCVPTDSPLNEKLIADGSSLIAGRPATRRLRYAIRNRDRTFGARLAGEIVREYGDAGLPDGVVNVHLVGSAGQSFGAFGVSGLNLTLRGEANDYVGKGLAGGRIVIQPPPSTLHSPILAGNTVLYGATGGEVYIAGRAGERFAVRNSGAAAVVEGVGDHGCEYMTGGLVIVLGPVGYNFGAGMTGGLAYVLDELGGAEARVNRQLVQVEAPAPDDLALLRDRIARHAQFTHSRKARQLLDDWRRASAQFLKVVPKDQPAARALPVLFPARTASVPV